MGKKTFIPTYTKLHRFIPNCTVLHQVALNRTAQRSTRKLSTAQQPNRGMIKTDQKKGHAMIIDFDAIGSTENEHFKGGEGSVGIAAFSDANNKIMRVTVHPHSTLGWHQHVGNSEIVYVLQGKGKVVVEGGEEPLTPGTCHYCPEGSFHSVQNPGDEDLVLFAVVPNH